MTKQFIAYENNILKFLGKWRYKDYRLQADNCECCNHIIKHVYYIENTETKEIKKVGSECLGNIVGKHLETKINKAIKSLKNKVKRDYKVKNELIFIKDSELNKEQKQEIKELQENELGNFHIEIEKINVIDKFFEDIENLNTEIRNGKFNLEEYNFLYIDNSELNNGNKFFRVMDFKKGEIKRIQNLIKELQKEVKYF